MTDSPLTVAEIIAALAAVEHWRPIAECPSYEVSSWGAVRRRGRRAVKPTPLHGYMRVCLSEQNRKLGRTVHRLVAAAFLGPPPFASAMVAHNDGDRTNNRLDNLRWASALENQADRHRHEDARRERGEDPRVGEALERDGETRYRIEEIQSFELFWRLLCKRSVIE